MLSSLLRTRVRWPTPRVTARATPLVRRALPLVRTHNTLTATATAKPKAMAVSPSNALAVPRSALAMPRPSSAALAALGQPSPLLAAVGLRRGMAEKAAANNRDGDPSKFAFVMQHVTKRLASGQVLMEDVNVSFYHGAKIGVLGVNGSGKTSLLRIIGGVDKDFDGKAYAHPGFRVGYLEQEPKLDASKTVFENVMEGVKDKKELLDAFEAISARFAEPDADVDALCAEQADIQNKIDALGCWDLTRNIEQAMSALRCPPGDSAVTNLSGGERRRVALCRLLLSEPDILLLDEPTNHLDAASVAWLEQFLHQYKGLVVAVTHDRYFLDKVAGYILEMDGGRCYGHKGNYAQWLEQKAKRLALQAKVEGARQKQLARELEWVRAAPTARHAKSKARLKAFDELRAQKSALNTSVSGAMVIPQGPRLGTHVLHLDELSMTVDGNKLFENLSLKLEPGAILGIVGPNGSGKTTLLRLITNQLQPTSGRVSVGETVRFGYNAQSRESLDPTKALWQEICGNDDSIRINDQFAMASRQYVAQFNFKGTAQNKLVGQLSGGERNRVALAKSMKAGCNVIILDEPTNDLDVETLRALEECLTEFDGSAIVVSHDRWFLDRLATHILAFHEDGTHSFFLGNYSDFEKERAAQTGGKQAPKPRFRKMA